MQPRDRFSATMDTARPLVFALLLAIFAVSAWGRQAPWNGNIVMPTDEVTKEDETNKGTRWAVLIAGSAGYWNYRHQVIHHQIFSYLNFSSALPCECGMIHISVMQQP